MASIELQVSFLAGTTFKESVAEAKALAIKLDLAYVCYSFNGVKCSISRNADIKDAERQYDKCIKQSGTVDRVIA